jgi:voltage-gated sodium channel
MYGAWSQPIDVDPIDVDLLHEIDSMLDKHCKQLADHIDSQLFRHESLPSSKAKGIAMDEELKLRSDHPPSKQQKFFRSASACLMEQDHQVIDGKLFSKATSEPKSPKLNRSASAILRGFDDDGVVRTPSIDKKPIVEPIRQIVEPIVNEMRHSEISVSSGSSRISTPNLDSKAPHFLRATSQDTSHTSLHSKNHLSSYQRAKKSMSQTLEVDDSDRHAAAAEASTRTRLARQQRWSSKRSDRNVESYQGPRLTGVVKSSAFGCACTALLSANALWIGFEVNWSTKNDSSAIIVVINHLFGVAFIIELVLRVCAERWAFFSIRQPEWGWNYLDSLLVFSSLAELAFDLSLLAFEGSLGNSSDLRYMRVVRVTRLARIVRVIRVVRFVQALRTLVNSILSTLRSLFWAMVLLGMIIYVFGIIFTHGVSIHFDKKLRDGGEDVPPDVLEFWCTVPRSLFTLFKSVSGGLDWQLAVYALSHIHQLYVIGFVGFITFTYFAVLNVVTGVFCQNAMESAASDPDLLVQNYLVSKKRFVARLGYLVGHLTYANHVDETEITLLDFEQFLANDETQASLAAMGVDTRDAWSLFKLLATTNDAHTISIDDFLHGCWSLRGPAKGTDLAKIKNDLTAIKQELHKFMIVSGSVYDALMDHHDIGIAPECEYGEYEEVEVHWPSESVSDTRQVSNDSKFSNN